MRCAIPNPKRRIVEHRVYNPVRHVLDQLIAIAKRSGPVGESNDLGTYEDRPVIIARGKFRRRRGELLVRHSSVSSAMRYGSSRFRA